MTPVEKLVTAPESTTLKDGQRHHLGPQAQRPAHCLGCDGHLV